MGRIRLLPDALINRIAAGEVVERPASVVKELVENSLDAEATSVRVTLQSGGRRLVRVSDDGCGMDRDDALLAVERHATSKLDNAGELAAIRTLGFRGEALSSIAAVSRFLLRTATENGGGVELEVHGGQIRAVREVAVARGTTVRVEQLFFNLPARRKFLRREATELSHIVKWMTRYALGHPELRLLLEHGPRRILDLSPANSLDERVRQIHGEPFLARLTSFHLERDGLRAHGLAGRPSEGLPRRDGQHFFVNGRTVQDRVLAHAVSEAYGNTMPRGRHPAVFLFVEMPHESVDVNVHPRKEEVRFHEAARVHDLVREAVASALSGQRVVPNLEELRPRSDWGAPTDTARAVLGYLETHDSGAAVPFGGPAERALPPSAHSSPPTDAGVGADVERPVARLLDGLEEETESAHRAVPLAQFRDSYIVAHDEQGLVLVDQHAAHERVLFERYLADADADAVELQKLLFPHVVELSPHEALELEKDADELRRLGFEIEPFGDRAVRLRAVPSHIGDADPIDLLRQLLGEAEQARSTKSAVPELRRRLVTTAACHAAIKVNHSLTTPAMQTLLDDLFRTVNPSTCPHGRPVLFRLSLDEIERAFRRR